MRNKLLLASAAGIAAMASSPALADETARGSFQVRAVVPAYCEINADTLYLDGTDGRTVGNVFEACNTPDGFQVVASYRALEATERVVVNYAGSVRQLTSAGYTTVANRSGAKLGNRVVSVDYASLTAPVSISLAITYL